MKKLTITILGLFLIIFLFFPKISKAESCHWVAKNIINTGKLCSTIETKKVPSDCNITFFQQQQNPGACCCTTQTVSPAINSSQSTYTPPPNSNNNAKIYKSLNFEPQVQIPNSIFDKKSVAVGHYDAGSGKMYSSLLAEYIKALYNYGLIIGSILAAVVLMGGGMLWLVSAGNDSRISQAKELITGSIVGLVILFSSWLILTTINPNLVKLKILETQVIPKSNLGCCEYKDANNNKQAEIMGSVSCKIKSGNFMIKNSQDNYYSPDYTTGTCEATGCCTIDYTNTGGLYQCMNTTPNNCAKLSNSKFYHSSCSQTPKVMNSKGEINYCVSSNSDKCATLKDGSKWLGRMTVRGSDASQWRWCYNHVVVVGLGKLGEPCGNKPGSTCAKSGKSYDLGARDCASGLWCYKKP